MSTNDNFGITLKTIDNLSQRLAIVEAQQGLFDNLKLEGGTLDYQIFSDPQGYMSWQVRDTDRIIYVSPEFDNTQNPQARRTNSVYNALVIANALGVSASNTVTIRINGVILESQQLVVPNGVRIIGQGTSSGVLVLTTPLGAPWIICQDGVFWDSVIFVCNSSLATSVFSLSQPQTGTFMYLFNCILQGGNIGIVVSNGAQLAINLMAFSSVGSNTLTRCIDCTDGGIQTLNIFTSRVAPASRFDFLRIDGQSTGIISNSNISDAGNFMTIDDCKQITISGATVNDCDSGIIINNTAGVGELSIKNVDITSDVTTNHFVCNSTLLKVNLTGCILENDKTQVPLNNNNVVLAYSDNTLDSFGAHIRNSLQIGSDKERSDLYIGQGQLQLKNLSVLKYNGVSYTDVSTQIKPSGLSNITLFDDLTNSILYVGYDNKFSTLDFIVSQVIQPNLTLQSPLQLQYWDGLTWTPFDIMVNASDSPYTSRGDDIFTELGEHNTRFDNRILIGSLWQTTSVNTITKYWIRIIILTAPLTQSPIINSLKIYGNCMKINDDGVQEYFGLSRVRLLLPFDLNLVGNLTGNIPNQDVYADPALGFSRVNNSLTNGQAVQFMSYLSYQQDTSTPVNLIITYFTNGTSTNPINVTITYGCSSDGEVLATTSGGASPLVRKNTITTNIPVNIIGGTSRQQTTKISLPGAKCVPRSPIGQVSDLVFVDITRNADTNPDRWILVQLSLTYLTAYAGLVQV